MTRRSILDHGFGRLSPPGMVLLGLAVVSWTIGISLEWSEFYALGAGCVMVLLLALAYTIGSSAIVASLEVEPQRVAVGQEAVGRVVLRNPRARRILPFRLEVSVGKGLVRVDVPSLGAGEEVDEIFVIPTSRRCVLRVGPVLATRGDPLGLARRSVQGTDSVELFVHPAIRRISGLSTGLLQDLEGRSTEQSAASGIAFNGLREYVPGDDRRHVHWRTSARIGQLMVRQFVDVRQSKLAVMLTATEADYQDADEFELAVSIAASIGATAASEGQAVTLLVQGVSEAAGSPGSILGSLSRVEPIADESSLRSRVLASVKALERVGVVICITGSRLDSAGVRSAAAAMPSHLQIVMIRVDESQPSQLRTSEGVLLLQVPSLDALAAMVRQRIDP